MILGKLVLSQGARRQTRVTCRLSTSDAVDRAQVRLSGVAALTVDLLVSVDLAAPEDVGLHCRHYSSARTRVLAADVQLTAVKVGNLTLQ
jgi:hypothetical protein